MSSDEDLIVKTIPEIIVAYNHGSSKKDNTALNLITRIGEIYQVRQANFRNPNVPHSILSKFFSISF